jgi:two-component system cell cycle sensor histidine kinase/response regulator CckA
MTPQESRLIELLDRSVTAIAILDARGDYIVRSAGLRALTGYDTPEGMNVMEAIQRSAWGEASEKLVAKWRKHVATGEPVEATVPITHADGEPRWVRLHLSVHAGYRLLNAVDLTELMNAQRALQESEALHRKIVENLPVGIYSLSEPLSGRISSANPALMKILGYDDPSQVIGSNSAIVYENPADRAAVVRHLLDVEFKRSNTIQVELPLIRQNRERFLARLTIHGTFDEQGAIQRADGVVEDITEQRNQQQALEASEQRFRGFFETAPMGMAILVDGKMVRANPAFCAMMQAEQHELIGKGMGDLTHPDDLEASERALPDLIEGRIPVLEIEKRYLRSDGSAFWARTTATLGHIGPEDERMVFVMTEDLTERRAIEEDLLRNQRLDSLGVLAGGIAHDFNNMLQGVLGNVSMVRDRLDPDDPLREYLERAETAARRARDLTLQLQTFASGGHPIRRVARLEELLRESVTLAFHGSRVAPQVEIAPDLPLVELDPGQMGQAFNNLFINAIQAMPNGGQVRITLDAVDGHTLEQPNLTAERYLRVVVQDRGVGIAPVHLERIFDPYYTTKRSGRGLGLAMVYSVIKRHDGLVHAESTQGVGSTFTLLLPASEATEPDRIAPEDHEPSAGDGRVLVMDDEPSIRELVRDLLSHFGYQVDDACHGDEALVMARNAVRQGRPYQVAILDLTIPGGRGGREIIEELRAIDPALRAIVMSGYTTDTTLAHHRSFGFAGAVAKPCSAKALVAELQRVMES